LAAYYLAAIAYALDYEARADHTSLTISAACVALAVWTKQEGIVYLGFLLFFLVRSARGRGAIPLLLWAAPGVVMWGSWRIFLMWQGTPMGFDFSPWDLPTLVANLHRLPALGVLLAEEMIARARWGILWPIVCFLAVWPRNETRSAPRRSAIAWLVLGPILFWTTMYVMSAWTSYAEHVRVSLSRLMLQTVPAALLLTVIRIDAMGLFFRASVVGVDQGVLGSSSNVQRRNPG
jgi:hypothetical protein